MSRKRMDKGEYGFVEALFVEETLRRHGFVTASLAIVGAIQDGISRD